MKSRTKAVAQKSSKISKRKRATQKAKKEEEEEESESEEGENTASSDEIVEDCCHKCEETSHATRDCKSASCTHCKKKVGRTQEFDSHREKCEPYEQWLDERKKLDDPKFCDVLERASLGRSRLAANLPECLATGDYRIKVYEEERSLVTLLKCEIQGVDHETRLEMGTGDEGLGGRLSDILDKEPWSSDAILAYPKVWPSVVCYLAVKDSDLRAEVSAGDTFPSIGITSANLADIVLSFQQKCEAEDAVKAATKDAARTKKAALVHPPKGVAPPPSSATPSTKNPSTIKGKRNEEEEYAAERRLQRAQEFVEAVKKAPEFNVTLAPLSYEDRVKVLRNRLEAKVYDQKYVVDQVMVFVENFLWEVESQVVSGDDGGNNDGIITPYTAYDASPYVMLLTGTPGTSKTILSDEIGRMLASGPDNFVQVSLAGWKDSEAAITALYGVKDGVVGSGSETSIAARCLGAVARGGLLVIRLDEVDKASVAAMTVVADFLESLRVTLKEDNSEWTLPPDRTLMFCTGNYGVDACLDVFALESMFAEATAAGDKKAGALLDALTASKKDLRDRVKDQIRLKSGDHLVRRLDQRPFIVVPPLTLASARVVLAGHTSRWKEGCSVSPELLNYMAANVSPKEGPKKAVIALNDWKKRAQRHAKSGKAHVYLGVACGGNQPGSSESDGNKLRVLVTATVSLGADGHTEQITLHDGVANDRVFDLATEALLSPERYASEECMALLRGDDILEGDLLEDDERVIEALTKCMRTNPFFQAEEGELRPKLENPLKFLTDNHTTGRVRWDEYVRHQNLYDQMIHDNLSTVVVNLEKRIDRPKRPYDTHLSVKGGVVTYDDMEVVALSMLSFADYVVNRLDRQEKEVSDLKTTVATMQADMKVMRARTLSPATLQNGQARLDYKSDAQLDSESQTGCQTKKKHLNAGDFMKMPGPGHPTPKQLSRKRRSSSDDTSGEEGGDVPLPKRRKKNKKKTTSSSESGGEEEEEEEEDTEDGRVLCPDEHCMYTCRDSATLRSHRMRVHVVGRVTCSQCEKTFSSKYNMNRHACSR
jgi:ATP-dependent Clp protease ATP-binding subunit ClpA